MGYDNNCGALMSNFAALDVALGLILLFFLLSVIVSAITEFLASLFRLRARQLERSIVELLGNHEPHFRNHPLIGALIDPKRRKKAADQVEKLVGKHNLENRVEDLAKELATNAHLHLDRAREVARDQVVRVERLQRRTNAYPSYIPSRTFVAAVLGHAHNAADVAKDAPGRAIEDSIATLPDGPLRDSLVALYYHAQRDAVEFRRSVERWYDDTMERVSGWYRRRIQWFVVAFSLLLAFAINADTLQIAKYLWTNPAARTTIASAASNTENRDPGGATALKELGKLPLPLGWHFTLDRAKDPQAIPIPRNWDPRDWKDKEVWALLTKLLGLGLTTAALMLGAPFWFDTLSKIARLRNTGAPPPASDAVRHGEGEETRRGPMTAPAPQPGLLGRILGGREPPRKTGY